MRIGLVVFAMAALAASTAAVADTAIAGQGVQGTEAAAVTPATPAPMPESTAVDATAQPEPAAASAPGPAADAGSRSTATPAAGGPAAPDDASASQPITLKMATVPPPADFKIPAGYRPVKRGLDTFYCTSITPIGSRMPKTYCLTREQVEERQRQEEIARREVAQKTGSCDGGGCGAN